MRKLKMKKKTTKPIRRKCHNCGKMATNPLVYHIVPSYSYGQEIPIYSKSDVKTNRVDLRGDRKITVYNYCNNQCCAEDKHKVQ